MNKPKKPVKIFFWSIFLILLSGFVGYKIADSQCRKKLKVISQTVYQKGKEEGRPHSQIRADSGNYEVMAKADQIVAIEEIGTSDGKYYFKITVKEFYGNERVYADAVDISHLSLIQKLKLLKQLLSIKE